MRRHGAKIYYLPLGMHGAPTEGLVCFRSGVSVWMFPWCFISWNHSPEWCMLMIPLASWYPSGLSISGNALWLSLRQLGWKDYHANQWRQRGGLQGELGVIDRGFNLFQKSLSEHLVFSDLARNQLAKLQSLKGIRMVRKYRDSKGKKRVVGGLFGFCFPVCFLRNTLAFLYL